MENKKASREAMERIKYEISQEMGLTKPDKNEKKDKKTEK